MQAVVIYTKPMCPYCVRAMALLKKKGATYTEICAAFDDKKRKEMIERSGGRATYPQIFIGRTHVGGCDDLEALERAGKLDALLGLAPT
jgi:glutaredoxin 3